MKKIIPIIGLSTLTLLPLASRAQSTNQQKIKDKTSKELVLSLESNNIAPTNTINITNKSHNEIIKTHADSIPIEILREHMLIELNKIRDSLGIKKDLRLNNKINDCTQEYAEYMHTNNWFEHNNKNNKTHSDRLKEYGFNRRNISSSSENLGKGQKSIYQILNSRLNGGSLPHRDALLGKRDDEIGIGYYKGYWVINIISLRK